MKAPVEPEKRRERRNTALPDDGVTSGVLEGDGVCDCDGVVDGVTVEESDELGVFEGVVVGLGVFEGVFVAVRVVVDVVEGYMQESP